MALKTLHGTHGNLRTFYYVICLLSFFSASVLADINVAIIFVPIILRACKIFDVNPTPLLLGVAFSINVGSTFTPFSSSENVLIAHEYGLDFAWFMANVGPIPLPLVAFTIASVDVAILRKIGPLDEERKKLMLEIVAPDLVIVDRKKFLSNAVYFCAILAGFIAMPIEGVPVFAFFVAALLCIVNRIRYSEALKNVDLKIVFFFIALFVIVGCMNVAGFFEFVGGQLQGILSNDLLVTSIVVLLLVSVLSGVLAQVPTAIVFISLLRTIYGGSQAVPPVIVLTFLLGINIGAGFLPQGVASSWFIFTTSREEEVEGFTYRKFLSSGIALMVARLGICALYLALIA